MKIAIVSDVIYEYISGLAIFTKRLIEQLKERVEKVVVITASAKQRVEEHGNMRIHYLKALQFKRFENMTLGIHPLPSIKNIFIDEEVDIVHCQSPALMGLASVLHANKIRLPVVFTHHFQAENWTRNYNIKSPNIAKIIYNYGVWLFSRCDHITCPSNYAKEELIMLGLKKTESMSVISNGVDANRFRPNGKSEKTILFIGRIMPEKCIETLIHASAIVNRAYPDYTIVIGGSGYCLPDLRALTAEVNPSVVFTERLSEDRLLAHLQACSMFVLPSALELQGIALLEAMACGKPTIASDSKTSAARELANFTFPHGNHEALAERIIMLIENRKLAEELGVENRKTIEREHDYSRITDKFLDLYKNVIETKNRQTLAMAR
jgi:glycosyltransferase involved in cell wall biosynthesis